jgi:hypothetical protein
VFLGSQLLQPPVEVFRDTEIRSHVTMVPKRYPPWTGLPAALIAPYAPEQGRGALESFVVFHDARLLDHEV